MKTHKYLQASVLAAGLLGGTTAFATQSDSEEIHIHANVEPVAEITVSTLTLDFGTLSPVDLDFHSLSVDVCVYSNLPDGVNLRAVATDPGGAPNQGKLLGPGDSIVYYANLYDRYAPGPSVPDTMDLTGSTPVSLAGPLVTPTSCRAGGDPKLRLSIDLDMSNGGTTSPHAYGPYQSSLTLHVDPIII